MTAGVAPMRRVTIVKTLIKQYRRSFFEQLRTALLLDGIELEVVYGNPSRQESTKADNIDLAPPLGQRIPSRYVLQDRLLLQWPGWRRLQNSDLVIIVNANRNVLNMPLLALSVLGLKRVALWGHGKNHQSGLRTMRERIKEKLVLWPSWWFAYTEQTAEYLESIGYNEQCITTINNAIDTSGFAAQVETITPTAMEAMRARLGLSVDDQVALYCGSLYPEKRLPEMLAVARIVAMRNPRFRLVIIGSGPQENLIQEALSAQPHLRYAGPVFGKDKAVCYSLSEFILNPGLVGLAILDAFAAGRPLLTLSDSLHSPEIAYLKNDQNGLLVDGNVQTLAEIIQQLLEDPIHLAKLRNGASKSCAEYSVEDMVKRVHRGIIQCLNHS